MVVVMDGAIAADGGIITGGAEVVATIMVGGIIAITGDLTSISFERPLSWRPLSCPVARAMSPFVLCALCRFLNAGMTNPSTRCGVRRPKSAKARNRGRCAGRGCRGLYGDLAAGSGLLRLD
jgi:hypothetical protein